MIPDRDAPTPPSPFSRTGEGVPAPRVPFSWVDPTSSHLRRDLRDIEAAVRRKWAPESPEDRQLLIAKLTALMKDDAVNPRAQLRAAKILLAMDQVGLGMTRPSPWRG